MKLNGKDIKVGDRVKHITGKEGRVEEIDEFGKFPIKIRFPGQYSVDDFYSNSNLIEKIEMIEKLPIKMDDIVIRTGDDVYSLIHGWVKVKNVFDTYFIVEERGGASHSILGDGKLARNGMRVVFWDEPNITPPAKPYKDVDVYQYLYCKKDSKHFNISLHHYHADDVAIKHLVGDKNDEYDFAKLEQSKATAKLLPEVEVSGILLQ